VWEIDRVGRRSAVEMGRLSVSVSESRVYHIDIEIGTKRIWQSGAACRDDVFEFELEATWNVSAALLCGGGISTLAPR
jgi:hypothetical protein